MQQTDTDRVRDALGYIPPDCERALWVRLGMSLKAELGEAGFEVWDTWSQQAESYSARDAKDVWRSFKSDGGVTAGTLYHEAKAHGWQPKANGSHAAPSPEEVARRKQEAAERAAKEDAEREARRAKAAALAERVLKSLPRRKPDGNPYLERKRVAATGTLRESTADELAELLGYVPKSRGEPLQGRVLVAPVTQDGAGIATLELIDESGRKTALAGGRKSGCYWPAQAMPASDEDGELLAIGEGVATVLSAAQACGCLGIAALSSGNLQAVALTVAERYPTRPLVILADLVKATGLPDSHAVEAARAVGARLAVPSFGAERQDGDTDFNDMARLRGIEAVRLAIEQAREPAEAQAEAPEAATFPTPEERPRFVVLDDWVEIDGRKRKPGVYFCGMTEAKRDAEPAPFETWICSPLHVEAVTFDERDNNFGRLLRFRNTLKRWREWSMPMELLAGDGALLRGELLSMGVEIDAGQRSRNLLVSYLQGEHPKRRMRCAVQVGWCGSSFVLPDNTVFGTDAGAVVFQSGERGHEEFTRGGTLDGWRDGVAALATGNAVLTLAISAAFGGPLLARCNAESGGLHFTGDSSTGKSSALEAACSVWGGVNYRRSWRATANGLEGAAALFNDCLLALDEISEADPREIGAIVYALGNGRGKQRMSRTCAARGVTRWRCMVLSSGEQSIGTAMAAGGFRAKPGQSVRLLDLPAAGKHGAWDELHGHPSGAAFSDSLKRAAATHFGHAGRAFLERLTRDERDFCALLERVKALPGFAAAEGQHKRAAARFALIGLAGELAIEYGITGWQVGAALAAAAEGFRLWCSHRGKGNDERRQIIEQVSGFLERHGDARFSSVDSDSERHPVRDRAGWWRDGDEGREFLLTSEGMREALKGFDFARALDVLQDAAVLAAPGANGERARSLRIGGRGVRVYQINADKLAGCCHVA